jgi:hypothetical protein
MKMQLLATVAALVLLTLPGFAPPENQKELDPEEAHWPLPPKEVAAGKFEKWHEEAKKTPSGVAYTKMEIEKEVFWVAVSERKFSISVKSEMVAVYQPMKDGSYRRCLFAGPIHAGKPEWKFDVETGMVQVREQANSKVKDEVLLAINLKAIGRN